MTDTWVAKKGDLRKQEFMETAIRIFKTKGYEKTSINDILKEMQITKGAFYYYFDSKEALLEEIVNCLIDDIHLKVKEIVERNDLSTVEKLKQIFLATNQCRQDNQTTYLQLYELQKKDENAFIARKFLQKALSVNLAHIQAIIAKGVAEGVFQTSSPREAAELYIRLAALCKEKMIDTHTDRCCSHDKNLQSEKIKNIITFYQETMEKMLGAKKGIIDFLYNEEMFDFIDFSQEN